MLKRIIQLAGLVVGVIIGWRLGLIFLEQTAPRRLTSAGETVGAGTPPPAPAQSHRETPAQAETLSPNGQGDQDEMAIYCLTCRQKRPVLNPREERLSNGRLALRGECAVCGRTVMRFMREER